jgi:glutamate synthase domain-containing protein 2
MKIRKRRRRRRSLSDLIGNESITKIGYEGDSAVQKDLYKIEDIKKLINDLKQHYNKVQAGVKIVRNELFEVKSLMERVEKAIHTNCN